MQFTINRAEFIKAMNNVSRAISSRTSMPILTGVKLEVEESGLILTGSDTDISIEIKIPVTDDKAKLVNLEAGSLVLPATFFANIVKRLPGETFTLTNTDGLQAKITSESAEFDINGQDANAYPRLPEVEVTNQLILPAETLTEVIGQTVIAVSKQLSQPILTGVHFIIAGGNLTAVATDRHRLAQRTVSFGNEDVNADIIIPGPSLIQLQAMLDTVESVEVRVSENQVVFQLGDDTLFYSRLLEGNYPDASRLIPTEKRTTLTINSRDLLQTIERAALLSHEGRSNVIQFTVSDDRSSISSNSPEVGRVEEEIFAAETAGDELTISFNPDYMREALKSFGDEEIQIGFKTPLDPFTLVPTNNATNFIQLITPVRTY
ncbi:DNA polymerase III subunit beta [Weissella tructae]|jgi:DNA polymerase-3 subunit beta|uniref:Beta sliding clamp n=2 Tax=Weissella TaxID=46255 RepID=A0A075TYF0_9LACO|nr:MULTISPECIES: DNA polymerase III subunit beta [Weissella]AIG64943.1 DNA polymerase III subunit beta [Weissella tructae]AIM62255.1 DNA polymerase III subunit beta [Weissella ceti]AIM63593.1 DNA polymerase III subunit beta [Weissella ceti]ELA07581.1 DNA polymerase III subunit beta [Weissella ceti NC36]QVV91356.1 DNA polymerase III subunit beta [Weissella tructae]